MAAQQPLGPEEQTSRDPFRDALEIREVRESSARDVGEALAKLMGMSKIRKGGVANDLVLRGFQQDNINVQIDGARIYGACPNNMDPPAFHVDFAEVQEVQISKGAFDVRNHGSLGGGVNIVSKRAEPGFRITPNLGIGSFGFFNPSVTATASNEHAAFSAGHSWRRSDPYRDGSGRRFTEYANYRGDPGDAFDIQTTWGRFGLSLRGEERLEFSFTHQNGGQTLYPYLQMDALYDNADRAGVAYNAPHVRAQAYFTRVKHWMTDEFRTSSTGAARPYGMASYAATRAFGGKLEGDTHGFTIGAEAFSRGWDVTNSMRMMGAYTDQHAIPAVRTVVGAVYADWDKAFRNHIRLGGGARLDTARSEAQGRPNSNLFQAYKNTALEPVRDTYPSANARLSWTLPHGLEVFSAIGHSVRLPDAQERYFSLRRTGADWVGNPALKPVSNTEADAGLVVRIKRFQLRPTLFYSRLANYITVHNQPLLNPMPGIMNAAARSYENVPARMWGGELGYRLGLSERWLLTGGASWSRGSKDPDPQRRIFSTNLSEMPPLKGRATLRYGTRWFFAEAEALAAAAQSRTDTDLRENPTPGYAVANLKAGVHTKKFAVSGGLDNVLDRFYYESFSYQRDPFRTGVKTPEPGRSLFLSASYIF
jgi:iron complex outermembrane receptor protein